MADAADLYVFEIPIRDNHQEWVPNQEEELSSGSHFERHGILLCGKVSCHSWTPQLAIHGPPNWTGDSQSYHTSFD